jgi:WD40 repeat protein
MRELPVGASSLEAICWSPDGTRLAVSDRECRIRVFTTEGRELWQERGYGGHTWRIVWNRRGDRLAGVCNDGTLSVWDAHTGALRFRSAKSDGPIFDIALSPDDRVLATGWGHGHVRLWDLESGAVIRELGTGYSIVYGIGFSREAGRLATGHASGAVAIWDVHSAAQIQTWQSGSSDTFRLCLDRDGSRVFTASLHGVVHSWDARSAELTGTFPREGGVFGLVLSPDGRWLAAGGSSVVVWDSDTGKLLEGGLDKPGPPGAHDLAFSPTGEYLAGAGVDGSVHLWDFSDRVVRPSEPATSADMAGWLERQAATVGRRAPRSSRVSAWVPRLPGADAKGALGVLGAAEEGPGNIELALGKRGQRLYSGHHRGVVRCWDLRTGRVDWEAEDHEADVTALAVSTNDIYLASGDRMGRVLIRTVQSGAMLPLQGHEDAVWSLAFSPDGARVASASADSTVRIWECRSGAELLRYRGHSGPVFSVAFSGDGGRLVSGSLDGTAQVWDGHSGARLARCDGHTDFVTGVAFSPDGARIASSSRDRTLCLWDSRDGSRLLRSVSGEQPAVYVAFSPDGNWLVSGGQHVRVMNSETGEEVLRFDPVKSSAWSLAWSPDGAFLVTSSRGAIYLWDTRSLIQSSRREMAPRTTPEEGGVPAELARLPAVSAALSRLAIHPPLCLVRDVLALLAGHSDSRLGPLASHRAVASLRALPVRPTAEIALAALLLKDLEPDARWTPPPDVSSTEMQAALARVLSGEAMEPVAPEPPINLLTRTADDIDDRVITLLAALGPDALARDPGLALRLFHEAVALPALSEAERHLLQVHVSAADSGAAQAAGTGPDRAGIAPRGPITALVPSQLAYPWGLVAFKHQTGGLLYRARSGRRSPRPRPTVLVLDVSPAVYGPVESLTRIAAFMIASSLRRQNVAIALVAAGGATTTHRLDHPAEVLELLTLRRREAAEVGQAMSAARALAGDLVSAGEGEPSILLLTHPWWGADLDRAARGEGSASVRGLFVQLPGRVVRPGWADACERWETLRADQQAELPAALGRILA